MTYDLHLEGVKDPTGKTDVLTFGSYPKHLAVRGIHKMIVRFLKCFLTPKGTDPSDPEYGTSLMAGFLSSVNTAELSGISAQAVQEVEAKLRAYDAEYVLDDDERLLSADLKNIVVDNQNGEVELTVSIRAVDGTVALFTFPLEGIANG